MTPGTGAGGSFSRAALTSWCRSALTSISADHALSWLGILGVLMRCRSPGADARTRRTSVPGRLRPWRKACGGERGGKLAFACLGGIECALEVASCPSISFARRRLRVPRNPESNATLAGIFPSISRVLASHAGQIAGRWFPAACWRGGDWLARLTILGPLHHRRFRLPSELSANAGRAGIRISESDPGNCGALTSATSVPRRAGSGLISPGQDVRRSCSQPAALSRASRTGRQAAIWVTERRHYDESSRRAC